MLNTLCANLSANGAADEALAAADEARGDRAALGIGRAADPQLHQRQRRPGIARGASPSHSTLAREGLGGGAGIRGREDKENLLRAEIAQRLLQAWQWDAAEQLLDEVIDSCPAGINCR